MMALMIPDGLGDDLNDGLGDDFPDGLGDLPDGLGDLPDGLGDDLPNCLGDDLPDGLGDDLPDGQPPPYDVHKHDVSPGIPLAGAILFNVPDGLDDQS